MALKRCPRGLLLLLSRSSARGVSLAAALLAFVVLPALHVLQHEREQRKLAAAQRIAGLQGSRALARIEATLHAEPTLLHEHSHEHPHQAPHEHQRSPGSGKPEPSQHGKGSIEHFSIALLEALTPLLPGPSGSLEYLPILLPQSLCPALIPLRLNTIRGPPLFS